MVGLVISESDTKMVSIALDRDDQLQLIRALYRNMERPRPEKAPETDVEKMVAFAEELELVGYKGACMSETSIRIILAGCSDVEQMREFAEAVVEQYRAQGGAQ